MKSMDIDTIKVTPRQVIPPKTRDLFLKGKSSRPLLALNILLALIYFVVILIFIPRGNIYLFWLLIAGEVYHLWQTLTYVHTVWRMRYQHRQFSPQFTPAVDVFITVAGEPVEIVEETVAAAKRMIYPNFKIHVLNDGFVANKPNWRQVEVAAENMGVNCITRKKPGGAKAGNINHALSKTAAPFFAVFDVDHAPHADFLKKTMGHFIDKRLGFVQTPQYYRNHDDNYIAAGAWEQQAIFFGAICRGKNRLNSVFMCGTNMVIRREAILEVGGMNDRSITEDFLTSMLIHERGWKSLYVPKVLAEGLAPEDFMSYYKQQFRWARGSLEIIFKYNPLFRRGLSWTQKFQYLSSASFYLSGLIILLNALFPVIFFFTGQIPFFVFTMTMALLFLPYMFLTVLNLQYSTNFSYTYRAVAFSAGSFMIYNKALLALLLGQKNGFEVTSKKKLEGNFLRLVTAHLGYFGLVVLGLGYAIFRQHGFNASIIVNLSWAVFNMSVFLPLISAAMPARLAEKKREARTLKKLIYEEDRN